MKDLLIDNRYRLDYKVGEGGFGLVYAGTDTLTEREVAIKLCYMYDDEPKALDFEATTYSTLAGGVGIPHALFYGDEGDFHVLVQELLGPSLEDVFNYCNRKFSLKTVLLIADQCIRRLKYIHEKGFLHCDIKPDNFLLGTGRKGNVIYVIDFGLARDFEETDGYGIMDHRPNGGTTRYAPIRYPDRPVNSRPSDLESLGYMLVYFARGRLPWQGLKAVHDEARAEAVRKKKLETSPEELCQDLPDEFAQYMKYTRNLAPTARPDYGYLLKLFNNLFKARGYKHDNVYDWTEKRFNELRKMQAAREKAAAEAATEKVATEEVATEKQTTEIPATEEVATEKQTTENPGTEEVVTEKQTTKKPATEKVETEKRTTENPATEEVETEKPPVKEPADKSPVEEPADKSPVEEPADKSPVEEPADKSPVKGPADKSPVEELADKSPVEEPTEKPT
ncbi:hypothetical protein E4U55_003449 [Claviceps digitariae]|nr:hypothetical protein E4U55_003449 [Claviceps digitariae]